MGRVYYVNPKTYDVLMEGLPAMSQSFGNPMFGVELRKSEAIPEFIQEWVIPPHPWVEYEKSDERWAIPIGYGKYIDTEDRAVLQIDECHFNFSEPIMMDIYA